MGRLTADTALETAVAITAIWMAVSDARTHRVGNIPMALLLALTLAAKARGHDGDVSGLLCALPLLPGYSKKQLGGADVKAVAVMGLYLGLPGGLAALMTGMVLAISAEIARRAVGRGRKPSALMPFLAAGFLSAAAMQWLR